MDIIQLYQDHSIPHATEGQKHCRPGWVNTACPYCSGNPGLHLGYNMDENYHYCWRCGWHSVSKTIAKLLNINEKAAKRLIKQYGGHTQTPKPKIKIRRKSHQLPSGITNLTSSHKQYLLRRGFDADRLEQEWNLMSTGPISQLDGISYKHRIIAPIFWNGERVSFQGRDATGKHSKKYMACPKDRELIHHKEILYGKQSEWRTTGICVEGITDVWRLGTAAFATFGIKYTPKQLRLVAKRFERVAVVFDDDPQATEQAYNLVSELKFRGVDAFRISIEGDPGNMKQEEANYLLKQILS